VELKSAGRLVLSRMAPGEDRWVRVRFADVSGAYGSLAIIRFNEVAKGEPVNGFASDTSANLWQSLDAKYYAWKLTLSAGCSLLRMTRKQAGVPTR